MSATSVEASLAGTAEGATAQQAAEGREPGGDAERTASAAADAINSSLAGAATAAAGAATTTLSRTIPPVRDPVAAGAGTEQAISSARVTVIIKLPRP
jgi:hypothetical protein